MSFRPLSPPDNVVFSATRPAVFVFNLTLPLTTLGKAFVNGGLIADFTAAGGINQYSNQFILTRTGAGVAGDPWTYTVTPTEGWQTSPTTVRVEGRIISTDYDQERTLTVGEGYVGDHTATALQRLLEQFKGSVNFRKWVASYVDCLQDIEDVAIQLLHDRSVDTASGDRLDGIGQIARIARGGRTDEDYRLRVRAELAILTSHGSIEDMLAITALLIPSLTPANIRIDEYFPKALFIRATNHILTEDPLTIANLLRRGVSAATYLQFVYSQTEASDEDLFRFSDTNGTSETSSSHGFSNGTYTGAK